MNAIPREEWTFETRHFGRRVHVFDELESTNTTAMSLASRERERTVEPFAVIAMNQTAGRGRFGRVWRSRPGSALLLSVVLQPPSELRRASILTVWAAVAVAEAVEQLAGVEPRIKWPNDLLVDGRKICGILIEQGAATVVGIGLNLNQTSEEFAAAGLPLAASLSSITGSECDVKIAAEAVLLRLDSHYDRLLRDAAHLESEWGRRTGLLGEVVEVERSDGTRIAGLLRSLGFAGMELESQNGHRYAMAPESVEHLRSARHE